MDGVVEIAVHDSYVKIEGASVEKDTSLPIDRRFGDEPYLRNAEFSEVPRPKVLCACGAGIVTLTLKLGDRSGFGLISIDSRLLLIIAFTMTAGYLFTVCTSILLHYFKN